MHARLARTAGVIALCLMQACGEDGSTSDAGMRADTGPRADAAPTNDAGATEPDAGTSGECAGGALTAPIPACSPARLPSTGDPVQDCVDRINQLRWECQCLPPLARWNDGEACAARHAEYDSTRSPHSGFRDAICAPGGNGQNECPGYGSVDQTIGLCLQQMWDEGPGEPFAEHGHYLNMTNPSFGRVACGFFETASGQTWAIQNFAP